MGGLLMIGPLERTFLRRSSHEVSSRTRMGRIESEKEINIRHVMVV